MAVGVRAGTGCQEAGSVRGCCLNLAGWRAPGTGKVVPEQGDEGSVMAAVCQAGQFGTGWRVFLSSSPFSWGCCRGPQEK